MTGKWQGDKAVELTDEEAYDLLNSIARGPEYGPYDMGEAFRMSSYLAERDALTKTAPGDWKPPPVKYRLAIDDNIDELMARNAAPRIDPQRADNSNALKWSGPYNLARFHLEGALRWAINPVEKRKLADRIEHITADIDDAMGAILRIMNRSWWDFAHRIHKRKREILIEREWLLDLTPAERSISHRGPTASWRAIVGCQDDLNVAFRSLTRLRHLVAAERTTIRTPEQAVGRPKPLWRVDFVWYMAQLWRMLTHEEPSKSEDSLFGSFVYSAWNSLDDNMPEVSFARAIRDRT